MSDRSTGQEQTAVEGQPEQAGVEEPRKGSQESNPDQAPDSQALQTGSVDEGVKRQLREAYLNDREDVLVVTDVSASASGRSIVVEFQPPHGETAHTERFSAPTNGTLEDCPEFTAVLAAAGVSPLNVEELVGARVPASYDSETGWQLDPLIDETAESADWRSVLPELGIRQWFEENGKLLLALVLVFGELVVVAIVLLFFI